jgi:hypothetical protein
LTRRSAAALAATEEEMCTESANMVDEAQESAAEKSINKQPTNGTNEPIPEPVRATQSSFLFILRIRRSKSVIHIRNIRPLFIEDVHVPDVPIPNLQEMDEYLLQSGYTGQHVIKFTDMYSSHCKVFIVYIVH